MIDGRYTIYILQQRRVAKSPWNEPDKPLIQFNDGDWNDANPDYFGQKTPHDVFALTGRKGWWDKDEAAEELGRIAARDAKGDYDVVYHATSKAQVVRHQFRLVKIELSQKTTVV